MFDIEIEVIRAIIIGVIVWFLRKKNKENQLYKYPGWKFILIGFYLLLFASILDITDNVDSFSKYVVIGDTPTQAILEKVTGYILSALFMLVGFIKFIPVFSELEQTKDELRQQLDDLTKAKNDLAESLLKVKSAEEDKKRLNLLLLQSQKMEAVGSLAGGIAHDFNNVLSVINGYSELVLMQLPEDSPLRQHIENINQAGIRGAGLTRQLLTFSRKQVLELKPVSVNIVINEFAKMLGNILGEDIELVVRTRADSDVIEADTGQLEQVLMNLAINAKEAMPCGGKLFIETEDIFFDEEVVGKYPGIKPGLHVMIAVTDTGEGMSSDVLEKIFDPFFTTKESTKGTGLGLATAHGIITQHHGKIYVYSEQSKGTIFKIFLPISNKEVKKDYDSKKTILQHEGETILLVDDNYAIRKLIVDTLEPLGYTCLEAACGEDALKLMELQQSEPQLLITDVIMPNMNGRELADIFSEKYPSTKILFMSGYTENVIVHHGVLDENINFVHKPITPNNLLQKIREVLDKEE